MGVEVTGSSILQQHMVCHLTTLRRECCISGVLGALCFASGLWFVFSFALFIMDKSGLSKRQNNCVAGTIVNIRSGPTLDFEAFAQVNRVTGCRFWISFTTGTM